MDQHFYGYKHWTLETVPRCFNIGKGKIKRPFEVKYGRNHKWHAIVKRFGLRVEVCVGPVTNEEACAWEIEQIALEKTFTINHSHDDLNDIGCNLTKGGDGATGYYHNEKSREKIRQSALGNTRCLGRIVNEETRNKLSKSKMGVKNPKLSAKLKGRVLTDEHAKHISEGVKSSVKHQEANVSRSEKLKGRPSSLRGQILSNDHRKAISLSLIGNTNTLGKKYGQQRCGLCHNMGHKRNTCSERKQ